MTGMPRPRANPASEYTPARPPVKSATTSLLRRISASMSSVTRFSPASLTPTTGRSPAALNNCIADPRVHRRSSCPPTWRRTPRNCSVHAARAREVLAIRQASTEIATRLSVPDMGPTTVTQACCSTHLASFVSDSVGCSDIRPAQTPGSASGVALTRTRAPLARSPRGMR